ncbi:chemotaxis protein MotB [Lebetimonas natsushimae]|uniref:Chemotaxis protein MotB n=1 Tax=Lebetimonas natsushimae TaxID=1936991 RepID=A0A292YD87_9BACT|nr:OmpA family protein [Lebetimonas natsushimae]GAX87373.1 chemotaxis protein MotB [Lebetimonas natsushimae]
MAKKKCKCECPEGLPEWLATFGDLMSLLLCFFVLLLSMSTMNAKKVQEAIGSLAGALSVLEGGAQTEISKNRNQIATPIEKTQETAQTVNKLSKAIQEFRQFTAGGKGPAITLEEGEEGFFIRLPADITFKPGSAEINNEDSLLFLKRISLIIKEYLPKNIEIQIKGFTDNTLPPQTSPYSDNWELSAARALSVLKILLKNGVNPKQLSAAAYGEYHPIASNDTPEGRAKNRRVEIWFFAKKKELQQNVKKSVLDKVK